MLTPDDFTLSLADPTRLRILVLLTRIDELCVCQLAEAIDVLQPKMSRHLSILRKKDILLDRRDGLWVFYRLHPELPTWSYKTLLALSSGCLTLLPYLDDLAKARSAFTCLPDGYFTKTQEDL